MKINERLRMNTTSKNTVNEMTKMLLDNDYIVRIEKSNDKSIDTYNVIAYKNRERRNIKQGNENASEVKPELQEGTSYIYINLTAMEGRPRNGSASGLLAKECEVVPD